MMEEFDKLVRDGIPEVIREDGATPRTKRVEGAAYRQRLHDKLAEEVAEMRANPSAAEAADIKEVLSAILDAEQIDPDRVRELRSQKADNRGRFEAGIVLTGVEE